MEKELSLVVDSGGTSQKVTLTANTSAQTSTITGHGSAVVYATVDCFVRRGSNPTALATGVDLFLPANTSMRLSGLNQAGDKLAFISASAGTVYVSPGA